MQKSAYGQAVPVVYGTFPSLASNIIDAPADGALEEVAWKEGSFKRAFTGALLFCLGDAGDGLGERRVDKIWANDIVLFNRDGATLKEKVYLVQGGEDSPWWPGGEPVTFTYDAATGMEHFSGYEDAKGFWGQSNEFYLTRGTRTQMPLDFLANLHDGAVPAYRDCVYVAFNRLLLKPWQESLPVFTASIYNATTGLTEICTAHLLRGGVDGDTLDLSALDGTLVTDVDGCIQLASESPRQLVDALAAWAFADICESDGMIQASNRADPEFFTIAREELAAVDADGNKESPPALKLNNNAALDVPNLLRTRFYDTGVDGQVNEVTANRQVGDIQNEQTLDMPIVASQEDAQKFTQMALDEYHAGSVTVDIALPPSRLKCAPGDVLDIEDEQGNAHSWLIQEQALGAPGVITCQCAAWNGEVYDQPHAPVGVTRLAPEVPTYDVPVYALIDTVALDQEGVGVAGAVFIFAATAPASQAWSEVDLLAFDNTTVIATLTGRRALLGTIEDELVANPVFVFDPAATVRVTLTDARQTLQSCTEAAARAGCNEALINGHVVRFTDVSDVSPGVYDVSNILFNLRGSETFLMPAGSQFLLMKDSAGNIAPGWAKVPLAGTNYTRALASPAVDFQLHYSPLELVHSFTKTLVFNSRRAISPTGITVRSDGAGGAVLGFLARSRGDVADRYWLTGEAPALTDEIKFDAVFYDPGTTDVIAPRRVTATALVSGTTSQLETTFTAAQLASFIGGAPASLEGVIYAANDAGRGFGRGFDFDMP